MSPSIVAVRPLFAVLVAICAVVSAVAIVVNALAPDPRGAGTKVPPGALLPLALDDDPSDPEQDLSAPPAALAPPGGAFVQQTVIRIPKPTLDPKGQRRVGIQVGHWQTESVPKEYGPRIAAQTGTSWEGITEVEVTMEIAQRVRRLLEAQGLKVDILPTTIPEGYLADAFVALHMDGDGVGAKSGYKLAHSSRRGPYEDALLGTMKRIYGEKTGLPYDAAGITRNMTGYYAHNWSRYQHATSPFTPSVIVELGFLSHDGDRELLVERPDVPARAVATGILQFLDDHPRVKLFGDDLVLPAFPRQPAPSASPASQP